MAAKVYFACPQCETPTRATLDGPVDWECTTCDHRQRLEKPESPPTACAICGCAEMYKQKDFPHRLGLTVLLVAFAASVFTYGWYEKWLTWAILIGTAIFDGVLYAMVGDAVVCYRCHAYHKGVASGPEHQPFDIVVGERYRQERLRREQFRKQP